MNTILILSGILILFVIGPRPRLKAAVPASRVPENLDPDGLSSWLHARESSVQDLTPGAEATIQWACPDNPAPTEYSFLYIHGFSATRQETAPVTERLAERYDANVIHARLEGHGVGTPGMLTKSEYWLQSVTDAFDIASRIGDKVIIVATSTGAPLAIWLAQQGNNADRIHAFLFMSPNFRIRSAFGFLLTWPWSRYWIHWIIGREISWEPENDLAARYWTSTYSSRAVVEMQKVVDWLRQVDFSRQNIPLATMYMKNDNTIDPDTAIRKHDEWGSEQKKLIPVTIDGEKEEHVFVGKITAPHRIQWCVDEFSKFLSSLK